MASMGEPDRKRRHFSSISPTAAAAAAKKQPFFWPSSEDKLDTAVLQFQNLKLSQKLEAQKVEYSILEDKFFQVKEKQQLYDPILIVAQKSWQGLINDLESCSIGMRESGRGEGFRNVSNKEDGTLPSREDAFVSRLIETGATESSSSNSCPNQMEADRGTAPVQTRTILCNLATAVDDLWRLKDGLHSAAFDGFPEDGLCRRQASSELESEVKSLRSALSGVHLKHKSLSRELQRHQDADAKNKAEIRHLRVEQETLVAELQNSDCELAALKAERDATKGAFFPVLNLGNKLVTGERAIDKQRDLQDMESVLKEQSDQASSRLLELKRLHEERMKILVKLCNLQNTLKSLKSISSSHGYLLVSNQIEKSKAEVLRCQALLEKLQVEKDNLIWRERELNIKAELVDVSQRFSAVADSRIACLELEVEKQLDKRNRLQTKLEEASRERGRKEIISDFKALISSFPEEMNSMQSQLNKYKEVALDIYSMRADMQSLSRILDRKAKECEVLSSRSTDYASQMHDLQFVVRDLKDDSMELKLFLDMYKRESTDSRDVLEAKDLEYKAWAHVQSLKTSLDEQNLELRVKLANEAEALSQQKLAAAEAEIAELRQKLEASKRDAAKFSDVLKSKNEENETYSSELETIGPAYYEITTQNQHLLQQVTERDDYNIKLVLEGVKSKQLQNSLIIDSNIMDKDIQQGSASANFFSMKASRIEDQLRFCSDQVQKLSEDRYQKSVTLDNMQKRLLDVGTTSTQAKTSLEDSQSKVEKNRLAYGDLQLEMENERFDRRRIEEELEIIRRKVSRLRLQIEGSSAIQKLRQELGEYREILKCKVCQDRPKEVVITKCYDLFCSPCVQKIIENRQRKCPTCSASFGANDVKPVYI